MTSLLVIAVLILAFFLFAAHLQLSTLSGQVQSLSQQVASNIYSLRQSVENIEVEIKDFSPRLQEELIAALWYDKFGIEGEVEGSGSPPSKLAERYGLRPRMQLRDPWFIDNCGCMFTRSTL